MRPNFLKFALLATILATPLVSRADTFALSATFPAGLDTLSFSLPASPTNTTVTDPSFFEIPNVIAFDTLDATSLSLNLFFNNVGDFAYQSPSVPDFFPFFIASNQSVAMYTGPATSPTFVTGTYAGTFYESLGDAEAGTNGIAASMTIATGDTPEPSSLILLGTGLIGLAGAARRKFSK